MSRWECTPLQASCSRIKPISMQCLGTGARELPPWLADGQEEHGARQSSGAHCRAHAAMLSLQAMHCSYFVKW